MTETEYILGRSADELRRLELQAQALEPLTRRVLDAVGLAEGMSVLDIGTGPGDVAMLAAARVGPHGRVLGIDVSDDALARARARAAAAQLDWVRFDAVAFGAGASLGRFDLVIGRYVVIHQPDPAAFVRAAAAHVTEGGRLAFVEMAQPVQGCFSAPPVAAHDRAMADLHRAFRAAHADLDAGSRLAAIFAEAGLPEPALACETPVGGATSLAPEWVARTVRTVCPPPTGEDPSWHALAERIRAEASATHSQLFGPRNVAAWVRVG